MRKRLGITLAELLVVVFIVAIMATIGFAAIGRSRRSAEVASNISKMRQLGAAFAMYQEVAGDMPYSAKVLRSVTALPDDLFVSHVDRSPEGLANAGCRSQSLNPKDYCTDFRRTFFMFGDFGSTLKSFKQDVSGSRNAGWLVDPIDFKVEASTYASWSGPYRRLTVDGAVIRKQHEPIRFTRADGGRGFTTHHYLFFCDPTDAQMKEWLNVPH